MKKLELTIKEARAIAVYAGLLQKRPFKRKIKADDILAVVNHLGMVQLDTISVVSRSHETALFSRLGPYDISLWQLLFKERKITEYLAHAAAIVPVRDIPLMRNIMSHYRELEGGWIRRDDVASLIDDVLLKIRRHGAVCSRDFADRDAEAREPWSSWYGPKPERRILANLWYMGELLISMRDAAFARYYDLPERILPDHARWQEEHAGVERMLVEKAMLALGVTTPAWLADYYRSGDKMYVNRREVSALLAELLQDGEILPVHVKDLNAPMYLATAYLPYLEALRNGHGRPTLTTFLSPFDNLIFNRRRMRELWQMDYTLEIYAPASKRVYGYYTMPILHKGDLIGLIDPSFERKTRTLLIKSLYISDGIKVTLPLMRALLRALDEFLSFLGGKAWKLDKCNSEVFVKHLAEMRPTAMS